MFDDHERIILERPLFCPGGDEDSDQATDDVGVAVAEPDEALDKPGEFDFLGALGLSAGRKKGDEDEEEDFDDELDDEEDDDLDEEFEDDEDLDDDFDDDEDLDEEEVADDDT